MVTAKSGPVDFGLTWFLSGRLNNSKSLPELDSHLLHLSDCQRADIVEFINSFPCQKIMEAQAKYLVENLAVPSSCAWSSPCLLDLKLDVPRGSVQV